MEADGSDERLLTLESAALGSSSPGSRATWSPEGRFLAFISGRTGNLDIWIMNADGSNHRRITNAAANDFDPDWLVIKR